ncbi:MAG: TPR end-of-group domain-containing protein [Chthoniobacterales bacterium]
MERRLAAILAADVVGYSRHMGEDEAGTHAELKRLRREVIDGKITEHSGRMVKLTGDGFLAEFSSVVNAVACAAEMQRGLRERESKLQFRMGVNLGDIIADDGDIYGDGVNVAARLESIAHPGGLVVSRAVRNQVGHRLDLVFEHRGDHQLKNIEEPIGVFDVLLDQKAEQRAPTNNYRPSIAVLAFTNMSGDPEQEYFSDGITEDIITDLSKLSGLSVTPRHTAFTYKGKAVKVQQIGRELGVSFVLEGSVRKAGTRVRVTGQLVSCHDESHLWAERFDRDLTDIFAIQDEITEAIVAQLKVKLLSPEKQLIRQAQTQNVEAHTFYLRGLEFLRRGSTAYYQLAREMFAKAVELDPLYARAYAGIADCDAFLFQQTVTDITITSILANTAKALALDDTLAEAHAAQAFALQLSDRSDDAVLEFEKAIALDPNSFEAHYFYGRACFEQGEHERAARLFKRASDINQDSYHSLLILSLTYRALGREEEAKEAARATLERAEREMIRHPEDPKPASCGGAVLVDLDEPERAREWIARSLAIAPDDILTQYNAACTYTRLGDLERALDLLERVIRARTSLESWRKWIEHDPDLNSLRDHPRFRGLLALIDNKA